MSQTTISTIIPAYNASRTIARAVDSLISQTRPSDEILVIDDGGSDDLASALRPFEHSVTLVRKPNGGAASARNLGIDLSRGDLIAFLDADDYWESTKLARQVAIFEAHPEVMVTAARFFKQPPDGPRQLSPDVPNALFDRVVRASGDAVFDVMAEFSTITVAVRRAALDNIRFATGLETAEDRDLWIQLIASWPVYLDSQPLATCVLEPGSLSRTNIDRDCSNFFRVIHRHRTLLSRRGLRAWESQLFRRWASGLLVDGRPEAALVPASKRLRLQPTSLQAWWIFLKCATLTRLASRTGPSAQCNHVA